MRRAVTVAALTLVVACGGPAEVTDSDRQEARAFLDWFEGKAEKAKTLTAQVDDLVDDEPVRNAVWIRANEAQDEWGAIALDVAKRDTSDALDDARDALWEACSTYSDAFDALAESYTEDNPKLRADYERLRPEADSMLARGLAAMERISG